MKGTQKAVSCAAVCASVSLGLTAGTLPHCCGVGHIRLTKAWLVSDGTKSVICYGLAVKMAKWWQGLQGCPGEAQHDMSDNTLECSIYCKPSETSGRAYRLGRKHMAGSKNSKKEQAKSETKGKNKQEEVTQHMAGSRISKKQQAKSETKGKGKQEEATKYSKQHRGLLQASNGPVLKLCGMKGVGHDLNTPYHGYPFDVAW